MSAAIYYFSGTGNCLSIAKELACELSGSTLYSIAKVMKAVRESEKNFSPKADKIVIVTPVYMAGLPRIVAEFLGRIKLEEGKKVYALATHGGMPGKVLEQIEKILSENGPKLSGGYLINMPGNCITLYSASDKNRQDSLIRVAKLRVKDIALAIREGKDEKIERNLFLLNGLLSGPVYRSVIKKFKDNDKGFYATEKCNSCELCVDICPVDNIEMKDRKPVWRHNCEQCMACIQWCPVEAIQHGEKTIKRKRYRHPDVKADELVSR
jgi:ferredoxin/flavodoxin